MGNQSIIPASDASLATRNVFAVTPETLRQARAMKMMLPNGDKLTDDNALALRAFGLLHDLDVLNGEAYYLVTERTDQQTGQRVREERGVYPGIKGKRKLARKQSPYSIEYTVLSADEIKRLGYNAQDIAIAMRGEMRDHENQGRYIVDTLKLAQAGYNKGEIEGLLGKPPVTVGYGIVRQNETRYLKQSPLQVARKRAENDCITQRFSLPFASSELAEDIDPNLSDEAEIVDAPQISAPQPEPQRRKQSEAELLAELGFASQPAPEEPAEGEYTPSADPELSPELQAAMEKHTNRGTRFGDMNDSQLEWVYDNSRDEGSREAARMILDWRMAHAAADQEPEQPTA